MFRLHLALRAYQELIQHLALLQVSKDDNLRDAAKVIKGKMLWEHLLSVGQIIIERLRFYSLYHYRYLFPILNNLIGRAID